MQEGSASMEQLGVQKPVVKKTLLEIQPHDLTFTFEVKKTSTCSVHLANVSDEHVAFKVKTTSPKKYCVRPNVGVIEPKSTFVFSVTMQAQKSAPSDMQCKDKFLIQSTVAPAGTTEEDITTDMFAKESGKYVEEARLKVILTSSSPSPVLLPVNGVSKQEPSWVTKMEEEKLLTGVENLSPVPSKNFVDERPAMDSEVLSPTKVVENELPANNLKCNSDMEVGSRSLHDMVGTELKLSKDIEELKSKLSALDSELNHAKSNITMITEEKSSFIRENQSLKQELVMTRRKMGIRSAGRGFPPLFVCMVALISLAVGFLLHG